MTAASPAPASDVIDLQGRVAIVTGAARGIGRAVAELLRSLNAAVVLNDIDAEPLQEAVEVCRRIGAADRVASHVGSVAKPEDAEALARLAFDRFGGLDVLVNNAGVTHDAMIHKMSDAVWREVLDVNLTGAFNCCRACAPYLRDQAKAELARDGTVRHHRKVVNVFSTSAIKGKAGQCNYAAAKAGLVGLTRALAHEWAPFRVNVNAVAPGFTDTRLTRPKEDGDGVFGIPRAQRDAIVAQLPFGRPALPTDVARVVLFFCTPLSDWVTGQEINCSGGHQIP